MFGGHFLFTSFRQEMNAERVLRRWDWHLPHVNLGGKSFRKCLSSIYRVDALSTFFSLDIKWLIYIYVSIWLFSIQTLSKGFCERTSVSPLISSEVHVDYQWWDFPVNLSHLSGENMMKFALRSICPLHSADVVAKCQKSPAQHASPYAWQGQKQEV